MSSFVRNFLRRDSSDMSKSPSFNDFSLNVGRDTEEELQTAPADSSVNSPPALEKSQSLPGSAGSFKGSSGSRRDVWQSVFNPGRNYNEAMEKVGRSYYDCVDDPKSQPTTWEYILKSENVRKVTEFDVNNDGFVTADEVRSALGSSTTIENLIKKTDKHGDGRVAYKEFFDLIRDEGRMS